MILPKNAFLIEKHFLYEAYKMATELNAIEYIQTLIRNGKKIGIFSCEDPYNTPFHAELYKSANGYLHFIPKAGGIVIPESLDLGLQAKGINAWGIFGHYGNVHGSEVCAAIKLLGGDYSHVGQDFQKYLDSLKKHFTYDHNKNLEENVKEWVRQQYGLLTENIPQKQRELNGSVQGNIVIFGGIVYNSEDGKSYEAKILFKNV